MNNMTNFLKNKLNSVKNFDADDKILFIIKDIFQADCFENAVSMEKIIELMESENYKDRFKAEYYQLKNRWEKLSAKIEADDAAIAKDDNVKRQYIGYGKNADCGGVIGKPGYSLYLLTRQKRCMTEYLHILEKRAQIEKIKL